MGSMAKRGRTFRGDVGLGRVRSIGRWPTPRNLPSALSDVHGRPLRRIASPASCAAHARLTLPGLAATLPADECLGRDRQELRVAHAVTGSEFGFLALGLLLGLSAGVALIETLRVRPPARREVRVTVAQDAIPRRRSSTLSDDAFTAAVPEPARGGPADRRTDDGGTPPDGVDRRTAVRSAIPVGPISA